MKDPIVLKGEFVDLRPLTVADAGITLQWRQSTRARHLNQGATTLAAQEHWIAMRPPGDFCFVIELKSGKPVGMVSLIDVDRLHRRAEAAHFLIGEEGAVRGIPAAVEAMKLLYELAFDRLDLLRVYGTIASDNVTMIRWQVYLGMKEEGRLRQHYFIGDHFQDAVCMGLLQEEYRRVTLPRMRVLIAAGRRSAGQGS
jgi:RimJ/RimL family protein N-acetyltransferase